MKRVSVQCVEGGAKLILSFRYSVCMQEAPSLIFLTHNKTRTVPKMRHMHSTKPKKRVINTKVSTKPDFIFQQILFNKHIRTATFN